MRKHLLESQFWPTAIAILGLLVILNYLPVLWGEIPFPRDMVVRHSAWNGEPQERLPQLIDIAAMFYPFRALISRVADEGTIALWNPYIQSGAPFQANAQSAIFSPLNILYYLFPLKAAWTAILIVRLFLAGLFMTLFVRSIGGSPTGSIFSGILFAFCGFTVQWQGMSNGDSGIWLPLMCYAVHRLHNDVRLSAYSVAIMAAAFAMPVLSGHPETAAHSTFAASAIAVFLWVFPLRSDAPRFERRFALGFVLSALLALGLAAVQMIPTLEWMGQLNLRVEVEQPVLDRHQGQGFFSRDLQSDPNSAGIAIPEGAAYVGMLGLLAATLAPFHRYRRYVFFLSGLGAFATIVAFGFQPVRWIVVRLPVIMAMKNARLILVVNLAIAAMAGLGISMIAEHFESLTKRMRVQATLLLGTTIVVGSFFIYRMQLATLSPVEPWKSPLSSFLFLAVGFALIAGRLRGILNERLFRVLICLVAGFEMLSYSFGYLGFTTPREVFPSAPAIEFLQTRQDPTPFRVAKDRVPIPHDAGMIYGFEAADGYDLTTERTRTFTADLSEDREDGVMFLAEKMLAARDRRLDMLNVKYVMVSTPSPQFDLLAKQSDRFSPVFHQELVAVFENRTVLPRFLTVPISGVEVIPTMSAQLERIKESSFTPERSVLFSESPGIVKSDLVSPTSARVDVVHRWNNGYQIRTESAAPSVIVISQMYYPGWKAEVDGVRTPVYPVNVALTGLIAPAGVHDIRIFFQPTSFLIGLAISVASIGVLCVLCLVKK